MPLLRPKSVRVCERGENRLQFPCGATGSSSEECTGRVMEDTEGDIAQYGYGFYRPLNVHMVKTFYCHFCQLSQFMSQFTQFQFSQLNSCHYLTVDVKMLCVCVSLPAVYVPGGCYDYLTMSGREHIFRLSNEGTEKDTLSHIQVLQREPPPPFRKPSRHSEGIMSHAVMAANFTQP